MLTLQEERQHLSHSQLLTMLSCPYKYYLQYVERRGWDIIPSSVTFGTAIHESLSSFHRALMNGGVKENLVDSFKTSFTEASSDAVFKDEDEFDELLEKGQMLIAEYTDKFSHIRPSEVEMEFRLPLVNTFTGELSDKDLVGKIDMIANDEIYEIKTGSSLLPKASPDENLQLILYGWAFKMLYGIAPKKLVLVNLVKTKQPKVQVLDTTIDSQKERKLMHLMFKVNEAIEKEIFYPNPRGMFGCSGCSYSLSCEYAF